MCFYASAHAFTSLPSSNGQRACDMCHKCTILRLQLITKMNSAQLGLYRNQGILFGLNSVFAMLWLGIRFGLISIFVWNIAFLYRWCKIERWMWTSFYKGRLDGGHVIYMMFVRSQFGAWFGLWPVFCIEHCFRISLVKWICVACHSWPDCHCFCFLLLSWKFQHLRLCV